MCPACIQSALLLLTGAGSAGGIALIASRVLGARRQVPLEENPEQPHAHADRKLRADATSGSR
jgi:hypothetical protein